DLGGDHGADRHRRGAAGDQQGHGLGARRGRDDRRCAVNGAAALARRRGPRDRRPHRRGIGMVDRARRHGDRGCRPGGAGGPSRRSDAMRARTTAILLACLILLSAAPAARAETLVRWTLDGIPSPEALGLRTIVLPLERRDAVETAARLGYRVLVEGDAAALTAAPLPASARGGV